MHHFSWSPLRFSTIPLFLGLLLSPCFCAHGQAPIRIQSVATPARTLSVNDVDFVHSTTPKWIFTIAFNVEDVAPVSATLRMQIDIHLATGEDLIGFLTLTTNTFTITGQRTITNFDLKDPVLAREYVVNDSHKKQLEDIALSSGLLPAGVYKFLVEVTPADGRGISRDQFQLDLTNPSTVELLSPFDQDAFVNEFPLFQWRGDAPEWRLSIFQRLAGQAGYEEIASGVPYYTVKTSAQSFQYPGGGSRLLQPGQTYVWFVEGLIAGAGGNVQTFKSALRQFMVAGRGTEAMSGNTVTFLDELERALGPQYKGLIDQIRSEGLSSGTMLLNGSPISRSEVLNILNQLRENQDSVTSVVLE